MSVSNINYVSSDFGLSMRQFLENANLYLGYQNSSVNISISSMGMSTHQLSFINIGTDTLFWFIEEPSDSWLIIEENSGSTAPGEREYINMNIDGSALSGGNNYSTEIVINSNDFNISTDFVESELIAYLAARSINNLPITFPKTTGVNEPLCGGITFFPEN